MSFPSTLKRKAGVFKFPGFAERFWKASFSWRISVDCKLNRRNNRFSKTHFAKFLFQSSSISVHLYLLLYLLCYLNVPSLFRVIIFYVSLNLVTIFVLLNFGKIPGTVSLNKNLFVWKDVLQSVDERIKQIHDAVPSHGLMLVVFGCSDLSLVKRQVILNLFYCGSWEINVAALNYTWDIVVQVVIQ